MKLRTLLFAISLLSTVSCTQSARRPANSSRPVNVVETPRPSPLPSRPPATPPPLNKNAPKETGSGDTGDYQYTFEKTGEMTVATFTPKLPLVQEIIEAAARQTIERAYGEKLEGFLYRVPWEYKDSKHAILLSGSEHEYVFVHITDETREVPQLIIWRMPKGSVPL